jgi:invasion protein IalB
MCEFSNDSTHGKSLNLMREPIMRFAKVVGILMISIVNSAAAPAQETAEPVTPKSTLENQTETSSTTAGWSMLCRPGTAPVLTCEINNAIYSNANQQRFLGVTFRQGLTAEQAPVVRLLVALPHGVNLESGVSVAFDKSVPTLLTYATSDASGFFAGANLAADDMKALRKAKQIIFTFSGLDQKKYSVNLETIGLSTLIDAAQMELK